MYSPPGPPNISSATTPWEPPWVDDDMTRRRLWLPRKGNRRGRKKKTRWGWPPREGGRQAPLSVCLPPAARLGPRRGRQALWAVWAYRRCPVLRAPSKEEKEEHPSNSGGESIPTYGFTYVGGRGGRRSLGELADNQNKTQNPGCSSLIVSRLAYTVQTVLPA